MKLLLILGLWLWPLGCAQIPAKRAPASFENEDVGTSPATRNAIYSKLLRDSLLFFDHGLRDSTSGQYYDAISLDKGPAAETTSSVAATGMGLVGLAIGDAAGVIPDARAQALKSLKFITGQGAIAGVPYASVRSDAGWFRHWFDIRTGQSNAESVADGYSTIDTAILAAGAEFAANYFSAAGKDPDHKLKDMANTIVNSVKWSSAIADPVKGRLYTTFDLRTDKPKGTTAVFNEYLLVACLGRYSEMKAGKAGPMTAFWNRFYQSPETLPKKTYQNDELLTDWPGHYLSSFVNQFTTYLCSDVSTNKDYLAYFKEAAQADRQWFETKTQQDRLWGLGAGEEDYQSSAGFIKTGYHADSIDDDPHLIASPHIVAGYLPLYPQGLDDLVYLYRHNECVYHYQSYQFLWRCSLSDPNLKMKRVQAIDFSSMILGLAAMDPDLGGLDFYSRYAAGEASP